MTMGRDHRRRLQTKRRFRQIERREGDALETVDDLAHAAQFAIIPSTAIGIPSLVENADSSTIEEDDNEIEVEDDDSDASIADADADADGDDGSDDVDDDGGDDSDADSDEDEDDEDLAEALKRMEQAAAEEEVDQLGKASNPPKTENELDGYKVPIQELESQLQIKLTVQGGKETTSASSDNKDVTMNQVSLAGKIKNYMVVDRTIVVESITHSATPPPQRQATGPLGEGSLLFVQKNFNTNDENDVAKRNLIPLGRIFEVFGPVSQPLYTIRLPSPITNEKKHSKKNSKKNKKKEEEQTKNEEDDGEKGKAGTVISETDNETITADNKESKKENLPSDTANQIDTPSENDDAMVETDEATKETDDAAKGEAKNGAATVDTSSPEKVEKSMLIDENEATNSEAENANPENVEPEKPVVDQWAVDGEYAKFLSQNRNLEVYYIQEEAKLIDADFVLQTSGKGCDASNIYDEEILNASEAYYSDDEKEREAKNKKKGRKKNQRRNDNRQEQQQFHARPYQHQQRQYNAFTRNPNNTAMAHNIQQNMPPPPPRGYGYHQTARNLPQGFHRVPQHHAPPGVIQQQPQHLYQYPVQSAFHRQAPRPPPPPPPRHNQPPPPPPPRNPNEPPVYQY